MGGDSEYEPRDSRNVTGTASTPDGRWTNPAGVPPRADGEFEPPLAANEDDVGDEFGDEDDEPVEFEPDSELLQKIHDGLHDRP